MLKLNIGEPLILHFRNFEEIVIELQSAGTGWNGMELWNGMEWNYCRIRNIKRRKPKFGVRQKSSTGF